MGLFTRPSTIASFALGLYLLGLPDNFGKVQHQDPLIVLALFALAVSKCGDGLSLDRKLFQRNTKSVRDAEYTWPTRLICATMACSFFAAGIAKVRHAGFDWASADNIANIMVLMQYIGEGTDSVTKIGLTLAKSPTICWLLGSATLVIEFAAILTLFSRRLRPVIVASLFAMQVSLWMVLGVDFTRFLLLYIFWVPWADLAGKASQLISRNSFLRPMTCKVD